MDTATRLRLVQVDFAARDDRSHIGWVFGTYACDGRKAAPNAWDNVFPIGLQYGNDPNVLQKQYDEGERPTQLWRNPIALALLEELGGNRPWLGWHDRLDGLADDFMGTCTSCHATAQLSKPDRTPTSRIQDPPPQEKIPGTIGIGGRRERTSRQPGSPESQQMFLALDFLDWFT
ncbi:hypothetical protein J3R82DRAFT_6882 [Butyriboletus roseoflavus]|nr:hypothetical protein J3R82DRAFT_6882 [Butyriboletus roseoflavus]